MKSILISIKPEWVAKILNGEKTIEIRKTAPKCELPVEVYVYCTKGNRRLVLTKENYPFFGNFYFSGDRDLNGKVVAKFTLKEIEQITQRKICGEWEVYGKHTDFIELDRRSCLEQYQIMDYMGGNYHAYAWHISDLVIFDKPKELGELRISGKFDKVYNNLKNRLHQSDMTAYMTAEAESILKRAPQSWRYIEVKE